MTLQEKKEALLAELNRIRDPQQRLAHIVARGRGQPVFDDAHRTDEFKVEGCLSNLWFTAECREGKCYFRSDSDSAIVRGIAGILCEFYSGHTPQEILAVDPAFLGEAGLKQHLTPNRRNALSRLWEKIRDYAVDRSASTTNGHK